MLLNHKAIQTIFCTIVYNKKNRTMNILNASEDAHN